MENVPSASVALITSSLCCFPCCKSKAQTGFQHPASKLPVMGTAVISRWELSLIKLPCHRLPLANTACRLGRVQQPLGRFCRALRTAAGCPRQYLRSCRGFSPPKQRPSTGEQRPQPRWASPGPVLSPKRRCPPERPAAPRGWLLFGSQLSCLSGGAVRALMLLGLYPSPRMQRRRLSQLLMLQGVSLMLWIEGGGLWAACLQGTGWGEDFLRLSLHQAHSSAKCDGRGGLKIEFNLYSFGSFFH